MGIIIWGNRKLFSQNEKAVISPALGCDVLLTTDLDRGMAKQDTWLKVIAEM
jgi:hypothetical protein